MKLDDISQVEKVVAFEYWMSQIVNSKKEWAWSEKASCWNYVANDKVLTKAYLESIKVCILQPDLSFLFFFFGGGLY